MLDFEKYTFVFVAINMLVLYFFMKRLLFKPVTEFMEKRTKKIKDSLEHADKTVSEAENFKQTYEEKLKQAKEETDKILNEARGRAIKEYDSIIYNARQDAKGIVQRAVEEAERERVRMLKDVKNQVASLALAAASKVIEANMDTERNRAIVDKFIDEEGAA